MLANSPAEIHQLFIQYMREGDIESVLTLYDSDAVFANQFGEVKRGMTAIRQELAAFAAAKQVFEFNARRVIQSRRHRIDSQPVGNDFAAKEVRLCHRGAAPPS